MAYNEKQAEYAKRYLEKFAEIKIRLKPEMKDAIQAEAAVHGESMQAYLIRIAAEDIERRTGKSTAEE